MNPGYRPYRCSEGEISILVENEEQWRALAVCLGRPELAYPGAWNVVRTASPDGPLGRVLEAQFREDAAESWRLRLRTRGVPVGN